MGGECCDHKRSERLYYRIRAKKPLERDQRGYIIELECQRGYIIELERQRGYIIELEHQRGYIIELEQTNP